MRKNRICVSMVWAIMCVVLYTNVICAYAADISLLYDNTYTVSVSLEFLGEQALCKAVVVGANDTKKITGTLRLYDNTSGEMVQAWSNYEEDAYYSISRNASVVAGHSYTLTFSGYVYSNDGNAEKITNTVTKNN